MGAVSHWWSHSTSAPTGSYNTFVDAKMAQQRGLWRRMEFRELRWTTAYLPMQNELKIAPSRSSVV